MFELVIIFGVVLAVLFVLAVVATVVDYRRPEDKDLAQMIKQAEGLLLAHTCTGCKTSKHYKDTVL